MPRESRSNRQRSRRSRLPVDIKIGGAVDQNAIDEYMANHELNPQRYKLPKPRSAKVDLSARSQHWDQGLTDAEKAKFRQVGVPAEMAEQAAEQAARDIQVLKREVLARDGVPRNFSECAALNDGVVLQSNPAQCVFNNMNFVQGKDFYYDEKGQLRKVKKRVRFAKSQTTSDDNDDDADGTGDADDSDTADDAGDAEVEGEEKESLGFLERVGSDLKDTFDDLTHFDKVPGKTSMEKIQYTFAKDSNRMWTVAGMIGVCVLILCLLGAFFYFNQSSDSAAELAGGGGGAEFTPDDFGFSRYPLIGMGD